MRDVAIHQMHHASAQRAALLLSQFEFLQTRIEAIERVSCIAKWYDRVKWVINPDGFWAVVDSVQMNLMNQNKAKLEAAASKVHIQKVGAIN